MEVTDCGECLSEWSCEVDACCCGGPTEAYLNGMPTYGRPSAPSLKGRALLPNSSSLSRATNASYVIVQIVEKDLEAELTHFIKGYTGCTLWADSCQFAVGLTSMERLTWAYVEPHLFIRILPSPVVCSSLCENHLYPRVDLRVARTSQ